MIAVAIQAFRTLVFFTVLTGVAYPLLITLVAQVAFPEQAAGSLVRAGDKVIGSRLLGQPFSDPAHFWSRPSATSPMPYNGASSSGSNQGPLNPALKEAVEGRVKALRDAGGPASVAVPVDLVTASGSGLDPHISPAAAAYQVARVAKASGIAEAKLRELVERHTAPAAFGILGEPGVNVLTLNLELDALKR